MTPGYEHPYLVAIEVYADGEARIQGRSARVDRSDRKVPPRAPLSSPRKSHSTLKALAEKGLKKIRRFTNHGRNTLRRAATAIEKDYGRENCGFLTLTCPGSTYWARRIFARAAGYFARRFRIRLLSNSDDSARGLPFLGVNEIQMKRSAKALHQHFLVVKPEGVTWEEYEADLQEYWYGVLCHVSDEAGVDLFERRPGFSWRENWEKIKGHCCHLEPVKATTAGYLGKYMTKGQNLPKGFDQNLTPDAWWYMNDAARDCMKAYHLRIPIGRANLEQLTEMMQAFTAAMGEVARKTLPLHNPWTGDWVGTMAYGDSEKTRPLAEQLAMIFKSAYQQLAGNAESVRESFQEFLSSGLNEARAWDLLLEGERKQWPEPAPRTGHPIETYDRYAWLARSRAA